jgi:HAD superfamily hydrolase (TIGR01509 family)
MMRVPLRLVIFDCDGVLVDSEALSRTVVVAEAARLGWRLTEAEARRFTGLRWSDLQVVFERESGVALPANWPVHMQNLLIDVLDGQLQAIPGAADVLRATAALGLPYRIASNSSHAEMVAKFADTGLTELVAGRMHSAKDVGVGKPAPDVFLAAAAAEQVPPEACLVIEDSVPGVTAARAAGMACIAYVPEGDGTELVALGARPVRFLTALPGLFAEAMLERAA